MLTTNYKDGPKLGARATGFVGSVGGVASRSSEHLSGKTPKRKSTSSHRTCRRRRLCGEWEREQSVGDRMASLSFFRRRRAGLVLSCFLFNQF